MSDSDTVMEKRVIDFIYKLDNHEIEILPLANEISYSSKVGKIVGEKKEYTGTLADNLSLAINEYVRCIELKHGNYNALRYTAIESANLWITRAQSSGVVKPTKGVFGKIKQLTIDNDKLQNDIIESSENYQRLSEDYRELMGRYKEVNERVKSMFKGQVKDE